MPDSAHRAADAALDAFESQIREVYQEAYDDAVENLQGFLKQFAKADRDMRSRMNLGEITNDEYREWRKKQVLLNKRYSAIVEQMAEQATNANKTAMDMLKGYLPEVAAENANFSAYQIDSALGLQTNFALQDAGTVATLLSRHSMYLPKPSVDVPKDMRWNRKLLSSAITKGVLLGESFPKISKRVGKVIGDTIGGQAMRVARTCVTAAENAGRVASYERAEDLGIELKKEWLATLDMRTRHSHRELDGQRVEVDGTFDNGCRFPGDPECEDYGEIANCRCTLVAAVDGIDQSNAERWSNLPPGMTYEEWKGEVAKNADAAKQTPVMAFTKAETVSQAVDYASAEFGVKLNSAYPTIGVNGANLVNEAMYNIKNVTGITDITGIAYKPMRGGAVAAYSPSNRCVFLGSSFKGKNVLAKLEKDAIEQHKFGWWSSSNPLATIYHEMGHHAHRVIAGSAYGVDSPSLKQLLSEFKKEIKQRTGSKSLKQRMTDEQMLAAKDMGLSGYAMWNTHELVAESYAQLMDGNPSDNAKRVIRTLLGENDRDKIRFPKLWRAVE